MAPTLEAFLGRSFALGAPQVAGPITFAPIFGLGPAPDFLCLEDALARGAEVRELPTPEVGRVAVTNPTDRLVVLFDGEEIVGAQQNRIVDGTVVVGPGSERVIQVCCVEQGRWDGAARLHCFGASAQVAGPSLRSVKSRTGRGTGVGDQAAVWHEVQSMVLESRTHTATGAMTHVFESRRREVDALAGHLDLEAGQVGFVLAVGARVWGVELVADPFAFARLGPRLLRGYLLEAFAEGGAPAVSLDELEAALARVARCPLEVDHEGVVHRRYRFANADLPVEGSASVIDGHLVGVSALLPGGPQGVAAVDARPVRTSETDPIDVTWMRTLTDGLLGLTLAPGKRAPSAAGLAWQRDLELDLLRLRSHHHADELVCLLPDDELATLGLAGLEDACARHGVGLRRFPLPVGQVPHAPGPVLALAGEIAASMQAGRRVVVFCRGGLERSGLVAGCALLAVGVSLPSTLEGLSARHPRSCPGPAGERFLRRVAEERRLRAG